METSEGTAGRPMMVLASTGVSRKTEELLSMVARPGFRPVDSGKLRGSRPAGSPSSTWRSSGRCLTTTRPTQSSSRCCLHLA